MRIWPKQSESHLLAAVRVACRLRDERAHLDQHRQHDAEHFKAQQWQAISL